MGDGMESTDCIECRVSSGGGLIVASAYIYFQAQKKVGNNKIGMNVIAACKLSFLMRCFACHYLELLLLGVGTLGLARVFNLFPFNKSKS